MSQQCFDAFNQLSLGVQGAGVLRNNLKGAVLCQTFFFLLPCSAFQIILHLRCFFVPSENTCWTASEFKVCASPPFPCRWRHYKCIIVNACTSMHSSNSPTMCCGLLMWGINFFKKLKVLKKAPVEEGTCCLPEWFASAAICFCIISSQLGLGNSARILCIDCRWLVPSLIMALWPAFTCTAASLHDHVYLSRLFAIWSYALIWMKQVWHPMMAGADKRELLFLYFGANLCCSKGSPWI